MPKNYVSRTARIEAYARMEGPCGASRDPKNLDYWQQRATDNSQIAPRASDGPMKLPSTGKRMDLRSTDSAPRYSRNANAAMVDPADTGPDARKVAKADKNDVGSGGYMAGIRRES